MTKVLSLKEKPRMNNVILSPNQIKRTEMIYCKVSTLPNLFDVSKPTCYRFLKEAENMEEFKGRICVDVSSTLTLVHIETFIEFLKTKHKKYL
ncbi:hypothetical protein [Macrococcoides caseolyticum]|uniref:hypothetical protein n=1 Tax=Macrococcoides caseolyticum TaxID=69966 RepID=UPI001E62465B|nr:hypothetical protein [Macrococcus caseolyticus]